MIAARGWETTGLGIGDSRLGLNETMRHSLTVAVPENAAFTRPYFERASIQESRYLVADAAQMFRPAAEPALTAVARYRVAGVPVEARTTVRRREPRLPYGEELRELVVVPAIAVNVSPRMAIVPAPAPSRTAFMPAPAPRSIDVRVELLNNVDHAVRGSVVLRLPQTWTSQPTSANIAFGRAGERSTYRFVVSAPSIERRDYRIDAVATVEGKEYTQGYDVIEHRDLETRHVYHPAVVSVRGIDVEVVPNLNVGYIMGVGDEVPAAIAQLGATVALLGEPDLARGDLQQYDTIVTGTRAYAVRDDLKTHNRRLLDYVAGGGNLIVLYNTQELVPNEHAPYAGQLTARAEEVSEEDSPVEILAPLNRAFTWPNRISVADFDGWVEQRGSKFWSEWDDAYTAMLATHDTGQGWQKGGWLTADFGKGHYTYFAYAFHRQLPYGVPGAYRLLANLL